MVLEGKRWSNYCPGCQIRFGEPEESEPDARLTTHEHPVRIQANHEPTFGSLRDSEEYISHMSLIHGSAYALFIERTHELSLRQSGFGGWYDMPNDGSSPSFLTTLHRDSPAPTARPKTPDPISKEDLTISNECQVCFSQHCCYHVLIWYYVRYRPIFERIIDVSGVL